MPRLDSSAAEHSDVHFALRRMAKPDLPMGVMAHLATHPVLPDPLSFT
jgi:hypothetical protein